ncbi:DUF2306 domain-containing protein [Microvirga puerhi]|uniref:DUF2306 domain-containing protein n=1 Tax=Microvirga puerhi TaxID=2876078 RepID=A0ABS7VQ18_9HYPH|nr:DUF2306 domain-containing protein [Microvirga puerhi]MBZ6077651.1 DUF2306 domain-containing protein [Microvirga puerhi]
MSLAPSATASPVILFHAGAALAALGLGFHQMLRPKGTLPHRVVGWTWTILMAGVALSSLFIRSHWPKVGPFGPIHILAAITLLILPLAVLHARRGRILSHKRTMTGLFFLGLVVTGFFTLLPGRLMNQVLFGP